jgi:CheY-like chemotaxis protein
LSSRLNRRFGPYALFEAMAVVAVARLLFSLNWLLNDALADDSAWGIATRRSRILWLLKAARACPWRQSGTKRDGLSSIFLAPGHMPIASSSRRPSAICRRKGATVIQHIPKPVVLVVEDETFLRMIAVDLIGDAGFEALEAANADQAVLMLEAHDDIRIVFTDIDMPGSMDGLKLAGEIRIRWPPIEIILTSGHYDVRNDDIPARGVFFRKPYDHQEVVATLHRMAA